MINTAYILSYVTDNNTKRTSLSLVRFVLQQLISISRDGNSISYNADFILFRSNGGTKAPPYNNSSVFSFSKPHPILIMRRESFAVEVRIVRKL